MYTLGSITQLTVKTIPEFNYCHTTGGNNSDSKTQTFLSIPDTLALICNQDDTVTLVFKDSYAGWDFLEKELSFLDRKDLADLFDKRETADKAYKILNVEKIFL